MVSEVTTHRQPWQEVIAAHPLESHDPAEWLLFGVALSQLIEPSAEERQQQQQAGLAFAHAEALGASKDAVAQSQRQSTLLSLADGLELADAGSAAALLRRITSWP
jgi:fatty acid/phospholipid biosynthesis enzyme